MIYISHTFFTLIHSLPFQKKTRLYTSLPNYLLSSILVGVIAVATIAELIHIIVLKVIVTNMILLVEWSRLVLQLMRGKVITVVVLLILLLLLLLWIFSLKFQSALTITHHVIITILLVLRLSWLLVEDMWVCFG